MTKDRALSFLEAAERVLVNASTPLRPEEILARALQLGILETSGRTPVATMSARLYDDIRRRGQASRFVQHGPALFGLRLHDRDTRITSSADRQQKVPEPVSTVVPLARTAVDRIVGELLTAQTDSTNPARFELAIRDAYGYLGFDAARFGGSGETDVLLGAPTSAGPYRVIVDGKSSRSGRVTDQQIDWNSLRDHRLRREAQHALVVAPDFGGGNLLRRADEYRVALLRAADLADVIRLHSLTPFSLLDLRPMFEGPGMVTQALQDLSLLHRATLARWRLLREVVEIMGRLPSDIFPDAVMISGWLALSRPETSPSRDAVQEAIAILATKAVGVLRPHNGSGGYALTMRPETALRRLRALAGALTDAEDNVLKDDLVRGVATVDVETDRHARTSRRSSRGTREGQLELKTQVSAAMSSRQPNLGPAFTPIRERIVRIVLGMGYQQAGTPGGQVVEFERGGRRIALSFRGSRYYPQRRNWWWTFRESVEGQAAARCDHVYLIGLMAAKDRSETARTEILCVEWQDAVSRVQDSKAWNDERRVHVTVRDTGAGGWNDRVVSADEVATLLEVT